MFIRSVAVGCLYLTRRCLVGSPSRNGGSGSVFSTANIAGLAVRGIVFGFFAVALAAAQDFRVETEVFVGNGSEPVSESLTLFTVDVVYDFVLAPSKETIVETIVLDLRRGKLVLLDNQRQVKASLTTEQLAEFSAAIKASGVQKGPAHLFQPQFQTTFDAEQNRLTLSSERLTYSAKGVASRDPNGAQRYRQFADWSARLNAIRPGNLPPFGRLELNQALADRDLIPQEIDRSLVLDRPVADKTLRAKSKHTVTWLISGTDQKRIDQVGHDLGKFREVSPSEYCSPVSIKTARNK